MEGGRCTRKILARRWNNLSITLICSYRWVYMQKVWSVWLPSREGSTGGGRQSQKCNLGPSAVSIGDLLAKKIRDTGRCNPLHVNRIQNKHLAVAVFRLLRSSSLYLNGVLKISVDQGRGRSKLGCPPSPCLLLRCSPWIWSRRSRSRGVSVENLLGRGFGATCCAFVSFASFAWEIVRDSPMVNFVSHKWRKWRWTAKSMLPENAKCSMTSLADTKHIFIERFMKPRISQLAKTTRG